MNESKWRPMEEAPRDGTEVYLSDDKNCQSGYFCLYGKVWFSSDGDDLFFDPICWHELPKPSLTQGIKKVFGMKKLQSTTETFRFQKLETTCFDEHCAFCEARPEQHQKGCPCKSLEASWGNDDSLRMEPSS